MMVAGAIGSTVSVGGARIGLPPVFFNHRAYKKKPVEVDVKSKGGVTWLQGK